jgi:hypothetical protein
MRSRCCIARFSRLSTSKALKKQEKNRNVVDNPYFDSDHSIYSSISMHYYYMLNDKITSLAYTELAYYLCDDEDKKKSFVTSSMSKLSRSERKLVGKILSIITDIAPKDIAEQIIDKIKEEMR